MATAPTVSRSVHVPLAQVTLDATGAVVEGNARAALLLGAESTAALAGQALSVLVGERAAALVRAHVASGASDACEVVARRRDGSAVALGFAVARRGEGGAATLQLSEPCAAAPSAFADAVRATLRDVAHGMRNPLAAALNSMDLVQRGIASADDLPALNRVTRNGLERMDRMIAGLQELARLGRVEVAPASPQELVREVVARVEQRARARGVTVTHRGARRALPAVRLDANAAQGALEALLENAIDASTEGDGVEVEAAWHPGARELHLTVTDRGEGIPPERAANVFRMYYSSRRAAGLGLSLARWVAAAHGGEVVLSSPPQGGTVATLRLRV